MILLNILCLLYIAFDSYGHHYFAQQLNYMIAINKEEASKFKGLWHTAFLFARISVFIILSVFAFYEFESWYIISISTAFLIAFGHEVIPGGFKIKVTCEKWKKGIDTDCIIIWVRDNLKINLWIVLLILWISTFPIYYLM